MTTILHPSPAIAALLAALLGASMSAQAHAIAGNRYFPGTITFDDPAETDEFSLVAGTLQQPADSGNVTDHTTSVSFGRLLTDDLAIGFDSGWIRRNWGRVQRTGATGTDVTLKYGLYRDDLNESLIAGALTYAIGGSGAKGIGANTPSSIQPTIDFGQGFGALPDSLSWLRPFAIAGAVGVEIPLQSTSQNMDYDLSQDHYINVTTHNVTTVHWGFALEYSSLYGTDRFTPGVLPKDEPLHQWVPLVEFAFDSPRGAKTTGTANPGISYVQQTWQVAAEAVVPLNHESGRGVGANLQLLFFLDDFMPSLFGKPVFGH